MIRYSSQIVRDARQLRAEELGRMMSAASAALAGWFRRVRQGHGGSRVATC